MEIHRLVAGISAYIYKLKIQQASGGQVQRTHGLHSTALNSSSIVCFACCVMSVLFWLHCKHVSPFPESSAVGIETNGSKQRQCMPPQNVKRT